MKLGVDLGTTWTAAAIHDDGGGEAVQLADQSIAMPSVVAVEDGDLVVGDAAERRLAQDPTAGVREFKRRLGDTTPHVVAGQPYGAEALMAALLRHVVDSATAQGGERPSTVALTHPANWGEFKLDLLREVARLADVDDVELVPEPVAAARQYVHLGRVRPGDTIAVFDFGGGTFDAAVVRVDEAGLAELLGKPEGLERLGGVDVDQAVLAHVDAALDGALREIDTTDPGARRAVARLRAECTAAKEALSFDTDATIDVRLPGLDTQVRLPRAELEQALRPRIDDTLAALNRAITSAGVRADELAGVLLIGGSSRVPLVAEMLSASLGVPTLIDADPKLSVAAGAVASPTSNVAGTAAVSEQEDADDGDGRSAVAGAVVASTDTRRGTPAGEQKARPGGTAGSAGSVRSTLSRQSIDVRKALTLTGSGVAAAAAVGGGFYLHRQWWNDDETADALEGSVDAALAALESPDQESLDAFEAGLEAGIEIGAEAALADPSLPGATTPGGGSLGFAPPSAPVGFGPPSGSAGFAPPTGAPRAAGSSFGAPSMPPPSRGSAVRSSRPRPEPRSESNEPSRPSPHSEPVHQVARYDDPALDEIREQLRERVRDLDLPAGTDPADAERLRSDLEGLLDRYQPYAGQSIDDAIATLRYEFSDRVRDFAQDQRIDALIEQLDGEEADGSEEPADEPDTGDEHADASNAEDDPGANDSDVMVVDAFDEDDGTDVWGSADDDATTATPSDDAADDPVVGEDVLGAAVVEDEGDPLFADTGDDDRLTKDWIPEASDDPVIEMEPGTGIVPDLDSDPIAAPIDDAPDDLESDDLVSDDFESADAFDAADPEPDFSADAADTSFDDDPLGADTVGV